MSHYETDRYPDWDGLWDVAQGQDGYFTTEQVGEYGYSRPLLHKYLEKGRIVRSRRGVYRLVHFPASEHEELVVLWLWSDQAGVFSHETALTLYDLSDALPSQIQMTLPPIWSRRRLRVPPGLVLHYGDVDAGDRSSFGAVAITAPNRTLRDCIGADLSPGLLVQAIHQARQRGLISASQEAWLRNELKAKQGRGAT
jgi:predicted transcriptional regulator of viral defense system